MNILVTPNQNLFWDLCIEAQLLLGSRLCTSWTPYSSQWFDEKKIQSLSRVFQSFLWVSQSFPLKKWISVFHWFSLVFWPSSIQVEFVLNFEWKRGFFWLPDNCLTTATELSKPGQEIFLTAWQTYNCLTTVLWLPDDCQTTAWFDHKKSEFPEFVQSFNFQSASQSFPEFL